MCDLCIDFGSTFIKYSVYENETLLFFDKRPFPDPCINDGVRFEVPLPAIDRAIHTVFEETARYAVCRCFIAVQMHGYVLQYDDGSFSHYVSWRDKSADITHPSLTTVDFQKNGTSLKPNLAAAKLLPAPPHQATFFTLGSYIAYRLTGNNTTHRTDGCASGFFDADTLTPLSVDMHLPTVTRHVCPIGRYRDIQIYTPVGDHQLSFLGSGATDTAYLLNVGTATQLSTLAITAENGEWYESRPYFDNRRLLTVSGLTGGERLFSTSDTENFCAEVYAAIRRLPKRPRLLVGGGGADIVFDQLKSYFERYGIQCERPPQNISQEGFRNLIRMNQPQTGTMLSEVPFPNFPVILKNEGLDFLIVDNEHGAFDYGFLSAIVMNARLSELPLIVRLSDNSRRDVTKLVDMGVGGFLLPMTDTASDIQKVVDFAKYAPIGKRGISTNRAHTFYDPPPLREYMSAANERVKVYAQIETAEGVRNIDEILSVNGVDGVFVGPNDLSCDLNCIGDAEPIKAAITRIGEATTAHGKTWGIITTSSTLLEHSLKNGVHYVSYGSEINLLKDSCRQIRRHIYG